MRTVDSLGIFWRAEDGHLEVPGIYVYAYWGRAAPPTDLSAVIEYWSRIDVATQLDTINAEQGYFLVMNVWVKTWPADEVWHSAIERTLRQLVHMGAWVAWCGDEYCSWSLAEFDPHQSGGCMYAAFSPESGLILHSELSEEMEYLSDSDLRRLNLRDLPPMES
jgi:hypothetical protein